jgi:steroid 5-alpha reductase family enzyme
LRDIRVTTVGKLQLSVIERRRLLNRRALIREGRRAVPRPVLHLFWPLALDAAVTAALFLGLWLANLRARDPSFVDGWWALGMVITAVVTFLATGGGDAHRWLLTGLCALWGLRLGGFLLWRWKSHGADRRYATMLAAAQTERGWSYGLASLLLVFALQAPLQLIVSLPVQLGQLAPGGPLGPLAFAGGALALFGAGFEAVADFQLARFKASPASAGQVMDHGLWRWSRHPNYFGEACVWWGLWLIACETPLGVWSLPGPLLLTVLLTKGSGIPTAEGGITERRPGYAAYLARTSAFVPWPPRWFSGT